MKPYCLFDSRIRKVPGTTSRIRFLRGDHCNQSIVHGFYGWLFENAKSIKIIDRNVYQNATALRTTIASLPCSPGPPISPWNVFAGQAGSEDKVQTATCEN